MRTSVAAYALIRRRDAAGADEWLTNWNDGWNALNLVGGHKEDGESFRECCIREIVEELHLAAADFRVAPEPEARLEYVADSRSAGEKTAYTIELFVVDLLTDAARARVVADPAAYWLGEREIRAMRAADGRAVSPTVEHVLIQAGLLPRQERYDLFVSYAHGDDADGFVTALAHAIQEEHQAFTREPLRIFFDRHGIRTGDDWERRIHGGLKAARALLSVLSPTYFARPWCLRELETFVDLEKARAWPGEPLTPVYAVAVPDADPARTAEGQAWLQTVLRKQFCDLLPWRPQGVAAFRNEEVRRRLKALNERLAERVRRVEQVVRSPSSGPRHNPNFVGREDELRRLREALAAQQVAAITAVHGVGGIGKSALAAEYAHVFGDEYPGGRFWLPSENHNDLRDLFRLLEAPLGLTFSDDERKDRDAGYRRVRAELERRPGTLVVFDNVNRPKLLAPAHLGAYRPDADRVHVLVTMREEPPADPAGVVRPLPLDRLSPDDGRRLLQKYRDFGADDTEWQAARWIVAALDGHALSLEVVGVFVWQRNRTEPAFGYVGYLEWMEKKGLLAALEGAARGGKVTLSLSVEATVSRLLEPTLAGLSEPERRALEYASLLPAERVALPWLKELVGAEFPAAVTRAEPWDPDPWMEIVTRLRGLRLFGATGTPALVSLHRVVRAVVAAGIGEASGVLRQRLAETALGRARRFFYYFMEDEAEWEFDLLVEITRELLDEGSLLGADSTYWITQPLLCKDRSRTAEACLLAAASIEQARFGPPELAAEIDQYKRYELAPYWKDVSWEVVRKPLKWALMLGVRRYGPAHEELAIRCSNLGFLPDFGLHTEDLQFRHCLLWLAVALGEKAADRPELVVYNLHLAMEEEQRGEAVKALNLLRKAIAVEERFFGQGREWFANLHSHVAHLAKDLGEIDEMRRSLRIFIGINQNRLDPNNPKHRIACDNLVPYCYWLAKAEAAAGDKAEAMKYALLALRLQSTLYGAESDVAHATRRWMEKMASDFRDPTP